MNIEKNVLIFVLSLSSSYAVNSNLTVILAKKDG